MSMTPKNPVTATQRNGRCLPIKAWHLGRKLFDEPYHLIWADGGNLTIRSGKDPNVKAKHSEVIDMAFAHRVWFVQPNEAYSDKVFVLETHETSSGKNAEDRKPFGAKFPELFKLGSKHSDGHVVIKFDSQSPAWVDPVYAQFIGWLKAKVDARETLTLRGKTGDDKWEAVNHLVTKAAEARIRRENRDSLSTRRVNSPALTEIPRPDNWSPSSRLKRRHSPGGFTSPYPRAQGSRALYDASFTPTTPKNGSILPKNACNRNAPRPEKRVKVESPTPSSEKNVRRSLNSNAFWPDRDHVDIIFVDD
ncbi:hypothetical protein C8R47DRAFT_103129 [Mycena vitilis]|nr:hypothetical protein C8R47DRAFT_103129 [Mycena vitilis]